MRACGNSTIRFSFGALLTVILVAGCARPSDQRLTSWLHAAQAAQRRGDCASAMPRFIDVVRFAPDLPHDDRHVAALVGLAQCEELGLSYHLAEVHATQAITLRPKDYQLFELRADIYLNASHHTEAVSDELRALRFAPRNGKVYEAIGITFADMGEVDDAIVALQKAISVSKEKAALELEEGQDLVLAGHYARAIGKLQWCARTFRKPWVRANAWYFIADAYLLDGRPEPAWRAVKTSFRDAPESWRYDLLAAKVADANAQPRVELMEAQHAVKNAADLDERAKARLARAQSELQLSDLRAAIADYRWVAANGPNPDERSEALAILGRLDAGKAS